MHMQRSASHMVDTDLALAASQSSFHLHNILHELNITPGSLELGDIDTLSAEIDWPL